MNNKNLDQLKLIVTILLILILFFLIIQKPEMAIPTDEQKDVAELSEDEIGADEEEDNIIQLPPFPVSDGSLTLDAEGSGLLDVNGVKRFKLSDDKQRWEPLISNDILNKLPEDYALTSDESNVWYIKEGAGNALYSFDLKKLEWIMMSEEAEGVESAPFSDDGEAIVACEGANPARLTAIGSRVEVVNAMIPLRLTPNAESGNILQPLPEGMELEITKLPVCTQLLSGANLWWGVRTDSGLEGWAAEASAITDIYYLQEIQ